MPAEATIEIDCDAGFCWALLADPRLVPEWVALVADAEILESDAGGRPIRVRFVGMPSAATVSYVCTYRYDDVARQLRWETDEGDERRIEGSAQLVDLGGGRCRLDYALASWVGGTLPRWARDYLADDTSERVVGAFRRFAERRAAARPVV